MTDEQPSPTLGTQARLQQAFDLRAALGVPLLPVSEPPDTKAERKRMMGALRLIFGSEG